jgi:septum site-determining protein MinD
MVEALAVASGKGGTGKTTSTLALGMALAERYDVTVVDADMGMANLLFHAGLADVETTLHDVLVEGGAPVEAAVYERYGMSVVPCGTTLADFGVVDTDPQATIVGVEMVSTRSKRWAVADQRTTISTSASTNTTRSFS